MSCLVCCLQRKTHGVSKCLFIVSGVDALCTVKAHELSQYLVLCSKRIKCIHSVRHIKCIDTFDHCIGQTSCVDALFNVLGTPTALLPCLLYWAH